MAALEGELLGDLSRPSRAGRATCPSSACRTARRPASTSRSGGPCPRGSGCGPPAWRPAPRTATARPCPSAVGISCWVTTPCSVVASCTRTCCCWCGGNTSMMRSIVCGASCVCRVANTRWPVSAAVIAVEIVSRSRISPTRITSGSWRSTCFRALREPVRVGPDLALVHDAALVLVQELDRVLDRHDVARPLACSRRRPSTASVVDLPEPVGPGHDDEPALEPGEVGHDARQPELVDAP